MFTSGISTFHFITLDHIDCHTLGAYLRTAYFIFYFCPVAVSSAMLLSVRVGWIGRTCQAGLDRILIY